ncbi:MAG TPA: RDD family protein [Acholeplasmataceae bacterium]|jgi:uncharacterized RDD family membrane protein YckC|nr:RDD family protein [Acholeplasmataceae bacterium]
MNQENYQENLPYPTNLESMTAKAGARIAASIVDMIVRFIVTIPLGIIIAPAIIEYMNEYMDQVMSGNLVTLDFAFLAKYQLLIMLYTLVVSLVIQYLIPVLTKGRTIGKMALGLRIISDEGEYASPSKLFIRSTIYVVAPLLQYVPIIGDWLSTIITIVWVVSFIFLFTDQKHQTVHDKYSRCLVVYDNLYQAQNQGRI